MSAYDLVMSAWNNAISVANTKSSNADQFFANAYNNAGAGPVMSAARINFTPTVKEPEVVIPKLAEGASIAQFNAWWGATTDKLTDAFAWFIQTYFPDETDYLGATQQWIYDAITKGGTGIAPHVEEQIWQRDRARVLRDADRAEREAISGFAARRYPLPPGAAVGAVMRIRADAQDKIAQASRDVAIKQAEIEIENTRFAIENAIKLYSTAINAAGDYIKALSTTSGQMTQIIPSITDSQSKLISAASEYYKARISVEELRLKATIPNSEWQQEAAKNNQLAASAAIKNKVDVAVAAAQSMGTQAAAALNAMHASAGVNAGSNTSVGYSYGGDVAGEVSPLPAI